MHFGCMRFIDCGKGFCGFLEQNEFICVFFVFFLMKNKKEKSF
jgi:hypothetical protein